MKLALGIILLLVGTGFICPSIAQLQRSGVLDGLQVALLFLGTFLTLGGVYACFTARNRKA